MHELGVAVGWFIWVVFVTEVVVMLNVSDHPREWIRGHRFELFVTVASFPVLLDLPGVRELVGVFPLLGSVKLLKALKILKLAKVFKLVHASSLAGWIVRIVSVATGVVTLGLVGSMVSRKKIQSPGEGVGYVADEVSDVVGTGSTVVVILIVASLFGLVEWWGWRQRARTITTDVSAGRYVDGPTSGH